MKRIRWQLTNKANGVTHPRTVLANTKSEARAFFKLMIVKNKPLARKGRLGVTLQVTRVA